MNTTPEVRECDVQKVRHDMSSAIAALQTGYDCLTSETGDPEVSKELLRLAIAKLRATVSYIDRNPG